MSNTEIAKLLKNIATAYTVKNENKFKFQIIAYQKASEAIANLNGELMEYYKENKLDKIPGIGPTLKSHLIELFKKGSVRHFDWVLKGVPKSVFVLTDIPTFGPKKAFKLVSMFNLHDPKTVVNDLEKIAKENKISKLEGFGEKSQEDILKAIEEFRLGKGKTTRMTLPYAFRVAQKIAEYLYSNKNVLKAEALGSLRRRVSTIGDIDFAVATNNPKKVIDHFVSYPHTERIIEKGEVSASILISGGRQIDLLIQPEESFGSLLQHFTGSKEHNVHLREYALKKCLSLSEYGIKYLKTKNKKLQKFAKEDDFYKAIGLSWIPPELRENTGEIELAVKNKIPILVELKDIKGDFHVHSSFPIEPSHDLGQNSFEDMIKKAISLGYEYIGFSGHNPSISKHSNNDIYKLLIKRDNELEKLKKKYKNVRIFKLLEVDILPNGDLAIDNKCLQLLDGAIVSVHSVFNMDKDKMTKRILNGLSHKKAKIFAHPTGRMIDSRSGYEANWNEIFTFAKKTSKALEINAWPTRLDLPDNLVRIAKNMGVKFAINTDSHDVSHMDNMKFGVSVARRGWATKNDILNTMGYNDMANWFKK